MNYYPFHLGDYAVHTAHLDLMEDLAYRRLIDLYYLSEAPIPESIPEVARRIRMRGHEAEVEAVLVEFFALGDDGWRHARCDAEIARAQEKQAKARASAEASVAARQKRCASSTVVEQSVGDNKATAQRPLNDRSATAELTNNQYQEPNIESSLRSDVVVAPDEPDAPPPHPDHPVPAPKRSRSDAGLATPADLIALLPGLSQQVARDYLAHRKRARAAMTPSALRPLCAEVARACEAHGHDADAVLAEAMAAGWQGFKSAWYTNRITETPRGAPNADSARPDNPAPARRTSAAGRVAEIAARERALLAAGQGVDHRPVGGDVRDVRAPLDERLRGGDRPEGHLGRVFDGDFAIAD